MKAWADMTPREKAEKTYKDIQERKLLKSKGTQDADDFMFGQIAKAKKERDKIYSKKYRGR